MNFSDTDYRELSSVGLASSYVVNEEALYKESGSRASTVLYSSKG